MAATNSSRQYDLVVFGATGYTGKEISEHITKTFPTNLRWALAGRSASKLSGVAQELKGFNPDREQPGIEEAQLKKADLVALAKKTTVFINAVGPYHLYSTPVVEACAENGTHYLDVTGESPWTADLVKKYHATAKRTGAIIIPQCGIESAPPDLLTYATANHLKQSTQLATDELVYALHTLKGAPSGGTLLTILSIFDTYGAAGVARACSPNAMTPAPLPQPAPPRHSLAKLLTGVRTIPDLGVTTTNPVGATDVPIAFRTWALLQAAGRPDAYGPVFRFTPVACTRNVLLGALTHVFSMLGGLMLALWPMRWLLRRVVRAPGTGPSKDEEARGAIESRAVAIPKAGSPRALGRMRWDGGMYHWTGVLISQAAATLLYDGENVPARQLGGGVLTPATLGNPYLVRLESQGTKVELRMLNH